MIRDGVVEAAGAEPGQVADGGAGAGKHDEVRVGDVTRPRREDDVEIRLEAERVGVGEVADPRHAHHGDPVRGTIG